MKKKALALLSVSRVTLLKGKEHCPHIKNNQPQIPDWSWLQIGSHISYSHENMDPCERDLSEYSGCDLSLQSSRTADVKVKLKKNQS